MTDMPESESEDEILDRIETALKKIADLAHAARPVIRSAPPAVRDAAVAGREIDRDVLAKSLDMLIARLRHGLEPHTRTPDHETE